MSEIWVLAEGVGAAQRLAAEAGLAGAGVRALSWAQLPSQWARAPAAALVLIDWPARAAPAARALPTLRHLSEAEVWAVVADGAQSQAAIDAGVTVTLRRPLRSEALRRAVASLTGPGPGDSRPAPADVVAQHERRFEQLAALQRELQAAATVEGFAVALAEGLGALLEAAVVLLRFHPGHGQAEVVRGAGAWTGADLRRLTGVAAGAAPPRAAAGRTTVLAPLVWAGTVRGLALVRRPGRPFNQAEIICLELAAAQAASRLGWVAADGQQEEIVEALVQTLERRDADSGCHSRRTAGYAALLLGECGLEPEHPTYQDAVRGALLHDLGKVGVPDAVLLQPGPLSEAQWAVIRQHPALSHQLLAPLPFLAGAAEITYAHHERFDGGGYPRGLAGEAIPFGARLCALVDAFDAMTSRRPYCAPVSPEEARAEIGRCAGTQFDPDLVAAFERAYPQLARLVAAARSAERAA